MGAGSRGGKICRSERALTTAASVIGHGNEHEQRSRRSRTMGPADIVLTAANWHAFDKSSVGKRRCSKRTWDGSYGSSLGVNNCLSSAAIRGEQSQLSTHSAKHEHLRSHAASCGSSKRIGHGSSVEAQWLR
jgi:hypothetical protein